MYYIVFALLYLVSLLPSFILYGFSNVVTFLLRDVFKYRKLIVQQNLERAFPEMSVVERTKIAKRFYRNLADSFVETIKMFSITKRQLYARVNADFSPANALLAKGKSVVYILGHQFGWEMGNHAVGLDTHAPHYTVYLRISNPVAERLMLYARERFKSRLLSAHEMPGKMREISKKPFSLALVGDQFPGNPFASYWLNFFGVPVPFAKGPESAARKYNTAVFYVTILQPKRGHYNINLSLLAEDAPALEPGELILRYRTELEKAIRLQPDNYLWSHRRWKMPFNEKVETRWIDTGNFPVT